jgi:alkanesulfonate monooxygenase SsuD/methylene tetrahydromethanopterin reductase-like flavin-dependent oxidoreductase (luciferase family)
VYLPAFGPFGDPALLVDLAVRAEAAGWDGVFLWDHIVGGPHHRVADPWTTLGAMAVATERIRIGPMVTPLPRRRPWVVARQASTVSRLSHGRLIVGTGLGSDESGDLSRFGEQLDLHVRSKMLDEGIAILRAVWSGAEHHHAGTHHEVRLDATALEPHPIPIWTACSTRAPAVLRRAAANDGTFAISDHTLTPEEVAGILAELHRHNGCEERHHDLAVAGNASTAWERPNPDGVDLAAIAEAGATWWMESLIHVDPLATSLQVVDSGPP